MILVEVFVIGDFWFKVGNTNDSNFGYAIGNLEFMNKLFLESFLISKWLSKSLELSRKLEAIDNIFEDANKDI